MIIYSEQNRMYLCTSNWQLNYFFFFFVFCFFPKTDFPEDHDTYLMFNQSVYRLTNQYAYQKAMIHIRIMMVICMNLLLHQALGLGGGGAGRVFDEESRWGFFGTELKLQERDKDIF